MAAYKGLTWSGFLLRFGAAIILVFSTYNPSGYSFYEFEPASLGGRPGASRVENIKDCSFAIAGQYAFGEFTFDTEADDPTVTFRLMHEDGTELYTQTLTRAELTPK